MGRAVSYGELLASYCLCTIGDLMTLALKQSAGKLDLITSFISGQLQWTLACEQHTHFVTMTIKDGNYMACEPKTLHWDTLSLRPHQPSG
jgi:hypothetical protein